MKKHVTNLAGMNLYLDTKGNTVYYNTFDKTGYQITKDVENKFRLFYHRYSLLVVLLILLGDYFRTFQNTLLFGAFAAISIELYFRFYYLKKLKPNKNFNKKNKTSKLQNIINSKEKEKVVLKACLYILFSILIMINAIQQNFNIIFIILSAVASIYSIYLAILNFIAINKIKTK